MLNAIEDRFQQDAIGVWIPKEGVESFGYSDGAWVERYLENAFRSAQDLSSDSEELEGYIKEWNTEYHLSRKRKDLLSGLTHDPSANVLEIGCGCGAITRFLGEQYQSVVAVEGSYSRARLARLRTSDLPTVEVVSSRYQDIGLEQTFDIVFCIGVLEYAPTYVDGDDPFRIALDSMREMLKPGGTLVIAIENKLGLKYFANSREDHAGTFFEGIEGYPRTNHQFATFGRKELGDLLNIHWPEVEFYFPFPDYKIPNALLSDDALSKVDFGEVLAGLDEVDYAGNKKPFFDSRLAWPEIARNGLIDQFSNSYLAVAGSGNINTPKMNSNKLAALFNRERKQAFSTETDIVHENGKILVQKRLSSGQSVKSKSFVIDPQSSEWINHYTIAYSLFRRAHERDSTLVDQTTSMVDWWSAILLESEQSDAGAIVPGNMIDNVWHNACQMPDRSIGFFDHELIWNEKIFARDLFLRAVFQWSCRYRKFEMTHLGSPRLITAIKRLAKILDITISGSDIMRFAKQEATLQSEIGAADLGLTKLRILAQIYIPYWEKINAYMLAALHQFGRAKNLLRRIIR